ncbi:hypothetical protein Tco_0457949 [Tanacetum coccineum]
MAEQNVPAQPPTRTDEQIVPRSQWLSIGKKKPYFFNAQKIQMNPFFQISDGILSSNTTSSKHMHCLSKMFCYLPAQKALAITPVNPTHPFELPPSGDTVIDFVNELGYTDLLGKTSGSDKPRHPVLQMLWGIVTQTNVDHAELLWEEFTQGIQTFFSHKASHKASLKNPKKKVTPLLIPYGRFSKVIIYYLASNNNIHRCPDSAVHHTGDDYILGNLKFVPKGESVEVFGMAIPDPLITEAIQQSSYYPKYLEMVAENTKKTPQESASVQPATKRATPKKPTTTTPVKQSKPAPPPTKKPSKRKLPQKVRKGKPTFQLMSLEAHQEKGEGEGDDADMERAIKLSLDPAFLPQGRAPVGGVMIRDPVSETTSKLHEVVGKGKAVVTEEQVAHSLIDLTESETEAAAPKGDKDQGEVDSSTVTSGVSIPVSDPVKAHEALAGPDPEPMKEDQTGSDSGKLHVSLAGPNPEHMDDEFLATAYPKVHENLKLITDERVIDDKPENDQEKSKVREESESTIPDPNQTVTSTPPVIAPFTDVSSSKPSLLVTPPPINTEATTITTSLPEITPFIALQLRVARLEQEMSEVKKTDHSADVLASIRSQVPTAVDNYLGTKLDDALLKVLERHTADLIEKYSVLPGPESVKNQESEKSPKEIIRAKKEQDEEKQDSTYSIRSTDKVDLEEFDLKSALFSHMNKKKSANRNTANYHLYHALMEALIADEDAMDKEVADKVKDHKRKHDSDDDEDDDDDEGPSAGSNQGRSTKKRRSDSAASGSAKPPPKDDDQSSKKPRETEASTSKQHPALTSIGWQITDTREAGVDSSMHKSDPDSEHSEQSLDDILMQDEGNDSDMGDTDNAHIPKVSTTTWFKPIPESERPATPEPEWSIPPNDFPEPENNCANAYATMYQVPAENKLQRKTYDIGSFIKLFCRRTGKKKLYKADLEGPAFNLVDLVNPEGHPILRNIYEPLPLGGPPATHYLDFRLEELVLSLWVESERDYDISAAYGIINWWFRRKEFYINKHSEPSDHEAVRSQMRILSVIRIKTFEKYGYNYLREIILRRADYKEYKISEKDFKNLHPNDFEDLYLLNIQDKLNHLSKSDKTHLHTAVNMWIRNLVIRNRVGDLQLGIESYQTKLNLERPNWDAADYSSTIRAWRRGNGQRMTKGGAKTSSQRSRKDYRFGGSFKVWKALTHVYTPPKRAKQFRIPKHILRGSVSEKIFKEDYTIVPKPRAVIYRDRNDQRKLMRLNEIHKFSDGTLTRVMEKLDHMVKDFHLFEYNKGMETRKWSEDDKRRSKDFITAIEKRLQIRRIFRSLESFVGGRIRDIDYRLINRTT